MTLKCSRAPGLRLFDDEYLGNEIIRDRRLAKAVVVQIDLDLMSFNDDDHHDWRVVMTDGDAKLYFDTTNGQSIKERSYGRRTDDG